MLRQTLIRLSQQPQLRSFAMHNRLAQGMASRFVAGETAQEALAVVRQIRQRGLLTTLDYLGENVSTREEAETATRYYCELVRTIAAAGEEVNISLKLTALGLDLGAELAHDNLACVVAEAAQANGFVRIDMESSDYVDRTLEIFYQLFPNHRNVGVVIQSYLYRSEYDLEQLIEQKARVRLVKGAYLEPPTLAFQAKADVDRNYVRLARLLLEGGNYPALATHDVAMIDAARRFARERDIASSRFEFQMLYGIRRDLQLGLAGEGYNMRVYVPFGTQWYPYLMRRMAERPANLMFVLGNLAREAVPGRR